MKSIAGMMKKNLVFAALVLLTAPAVGAPTTTLNLPARSPSAMTGSQFYNYVLNMTNAQREQAIINEIATGNVPSFLRTLKPITVNATINSVQHTATYYVTCDYTAIGSDSDFFRMPMSAPLAQQVADIAGCSLPTRKMVNDIYTAAEVKLAPYPFSPATYDIDSVEVFWLSQQAIETQRTGHANGLLVGGIKKDVVITPQLSQRPAPARVAIYGWHQLNGTPIQPLSLVHESTYEDYSHGIRLVGEVATVDGADKTIPATIGDANTSALLSDEGVFTVETVYPIPNPYPLPGAPNLVINGSFENGFVSGVGTAWTSWTALGAVTFGQASLNKYDGSYAQYWAINSTAPFDAGVYQTIAVTPGATYRIQGQIKRQSLFPATLMQLGYDLSGGTSGTAGSVVYTTLTGTTDNSWMAYDQSTVATGPTITLFARGGHSDSTGATNSYFYLDALSMVKTADPVASPTPSPTATAAPSATPTASPTSSPTPSPTATAAPSATPTASLTATPSPTPQVTQSPVENTTFLTY